MKRKQLTVAAFVQRAKAVEHHGQRSCAVDRHPLREQIIECLRQGIQKPAIMRVLRQEAAPPLTLHQLKVMQRRMQKGKV